MEQYTIVNDPFQDIVDDITNIKKNFERVLEELGKVHVEGGHLEQRWYNEQVKEARNVYNKLQFYLKV